MQQSPTGRSSAGRRSAARSSAGRSSDRARWPSDGRIALGLIGLAWTQRIFFLFSNVDRSWGFSIFYEGDSEIFYNYARAILAGVSYDAGIPFHPPVFPHFLSFVHTLIGAGDAAARVPYLPLKITMALIGSIPVGLIYLIARRSLGRSAAFLASLLTLYSFGQYVISIAPVSEGLYSAFLLTAVLTWLSLRRRIADGRGSKGTWTFAVLLGLLSGLLALTRAEGLLPALLLLGMLVATAWSSRRTIPAALAPCVVVLAAMLLTMTPWTIRNARNLSMANRSLAGTLAEPLPQFVPITAYGPLNFALANHAEANGEFSREILSSQKESALLDIRDPQHLRFFLHGYAIGWEWIRQHPGDFVTLVLKKWRLFFGSLELGWTQWNVPGGLNGVRRPVDVFVPTSPAALFVTVPLLLLGAFLCAPIGRRLRNPGTQAGQDQPEGFLVLVLLLTGAALATAALFFGYARLGVVLLPFWYSLMAVALIWIGSLVKTWILRQRGAAGPRLHVRPRLVVLATLGVLLLLEGWGATGDRTFNATGTTLLGASYLNPHDTMHLEVIHD